MDEKQKNYELAVEYMNLTDAIDDDYLEAAELFELAGDYKDAELLIPKCKELAEKYKAQLIIKKKKRKVRSALLTLLIILVILAGAFAIKSGADLYNCLCARQLMSEQKYDEADNHLKKVSDYAVGLIIANKTKYELGVKMYENGKYERARRYFADIENYKDGLEKENEARYMIASEYFEAKDYQNAYRVFSNIAEYRDCADRAEAVLESCYNEAVSFIEKGEYGTAYNNLTLECMESYRDSALQAGLASYKNAEALFEKADYKAAVEAYENAANYEDSSSKLLEAKYRYACDLLESKKAYSDARSIFSELMNYKDSRTLAEECRYLRALERYEQKNYEEAARLLTMLGDYKDSEQWLAKAEAQLK